MQKLDSTLDHIYPIDCSHIIKALDLYLELFKEGIVQNDLKANNVMLDSQGKIYIVDYGAAKIIPKPKKEMTEFMDGERESWPSSMRFHIGQMSRASFTVII